MSQMFVDGFRVDQHWPIPVSISDGEGKQIGPDFDMAAYRASSLAKIGVTEIHESDGGET